MCFRAAEDLLTEVRYNLLRENAKKLESGINIKSGKLLDHLVRDEGITEKDKDSIMVRIYYYQIVIYINIMDNHTFSQKKENRVMSDE